MINGHHAEALLTSVFTFEKIIHRTLTQLIVFAGFRNSDADLLLKKMRGFKRQKEINIKTSKTGIRPHTLIYFYLGGRRTWCQNEGYQGHAAIICDYFRGHEDYLASFCRE